MQKQWNHLSKQGSDKELWKIQVACVVLLKANRCANDLQKTGAMIRPENRNYGKK